MFIAEVIHSVNEGREATPSFTTLHTGGEFRSECKCLCLKFTSFGGGGVVRPSRKKPPRPLDTPPREGNFVLSVSALSWAPSLGGGGVGESKQKKSHPCPSGHPLQGMDLLGCKCLCLNSPPLEGLGW